MESVLLVVHVVVALAILGLIMLQQGKGAEMGASFGAGSSQTVFGPAGSGNFFSRLTAVMVTVFFATSVTLAILSKERVDVVARDVPVLESIQTERQDVIPGENAPTRSDSIPPALDSGQAVPTE